jgi:xylulokinase
MSFYLGLDSSTQSLTAVVLDVRGRDRSIVFQHALSFDRELPGYGTRHGVLPDADARVALSSPLMWADALDRIMGVVSNALGADLGHVRAVSGSAQQHGTVYLNESAEARWAALSAAEPLAAQIDRIFSRERSPIWMDASTSTECAAITQALGGARRVAELTGSRAFERFAGPQIRKFYEQDPEAYANTAAIHLVSSYMASLLAGRHAPIDPGDGSGMNLMDIRSRSWAAAALDATAPGLAAKLPPVVPSWAVVGELSSYWMERYGFPAAKVVAWSGDNPCSLIGTGLVEEGRLAISLGTSDTLFAFMREPRIDPLQVGHVFGSPTGDYMALVCFANGSLARERIRDEYGLDWNGFSNALRTTRPGNGGAIMLPWFVPEITPPVPTPGVRRCGLDPKDAPANVRAVVEGQMLSMAIHSEWTGVRAKTIHATGGASVNREILRIMADVHDADVYQLDVPASAAVGAALRAFHADEASEGRQPSWRDIVAGVAEPVPSTRVAPVPENVRVYDQLKGQYARCEADALA